MLHGYTTDWSGVPVVMVTTSLCMRVEELGSLVQTTGQTGLTSSRDEVSDQVLPCELHARHWAEDEGDKEGAAI